MISFFIFILGVIFGSFANMLIYRLPQNISLINPARSFCPNCKKQIFWYENIPLLSYLLLKAKCSKCKSTIPFQYPLVEFICGIITLFLYSKLNFSMELLYSAIFFYILIILSFIDFKYKAVPDYLLLLAFIFSFFISKESFLYSLKNAMIFAGGFVLLNFIITFYIQNIKSRVLKDDKLKEQEALGEGDIPIIASIGIILGIKLGLIAIFLSAVFAIIPAIYNSFSKKGIEVAFIPYLSLGLFITYIFKNYFTSLVG